MDLKSAFVVCSFVAGSSIGCELVSGPVAAPPPARDLADAGAQDAGSDASGAPEAARPGPRPTGEIQSGSHMAGSMGLIRGFASDGIAVQSDPLGQSVRLDAVSVDPAWWAMIGLTFRAPLSSERWTPGLVRTFLPGVDDADGLGVTVRGCSGPSYGNYTYDGIADRVSVHVLPGDTPDTLVLSVAAHWDAAGQVVTATFRFTRR